MNTDLQTNERGGFDASGIYQYDTQTGEGFDAIYELGHDAATKVHRTGILAGKPTIYGDQASIDAAARIAAKSYREDRQARVANLTNDDEKFDAAWAAGYVVAIIAEQDTYLSDPEGYYTELCQSELQLPAAHIVDAVEE